MNGAAEKAAIFQSFAREAIKNSHQAIKACWMILFTGGTILLLRSLDQIVECGFSRQKPTASLGDNHWCFQINDLRAIPLLTSVLLFVVYILTFYRFYVGNSRVFDMRYDEAFKFMDTLNSEEQSASHASSGCARRDEKLLGKDSAYDLRFGYSDGLNKFESIFLIFKTLIIVYLPMSLLQPVKFLITYWALLVADVIWMTMSDIRLDPESRGKTEAGSAKEELAGESVKHGTFIGMFFTVFPELENPKLNGQKLVCSPIENVFPKYAFKVWKQNNKAFFVFIAILMIPLVLKWLGKIHIGVQQENGLIFIGALLMLMNCLVDLTQTWSFYNPRFGSAYKTILEGAK